MRRALAALLLATALGLAACGGGVDDEGDVENVIKDWARAASDRDPDQFCGDLVTDEFVEGLSLATGEKAREECRNLLKATEQGLTIKVLQVKSVKIDGDNATAVVRTETRGRQPFDQTFKLEKEDGDFRITTISDD
jgi:hypothetical protein